MIGLEVSKYRIHYGSCKDCKPNEEYFDTRSQYIRDIDESLCLAYETAAHLGKKMYEEKAFGYACYKKKNHIELQLLIDNLENHKKQVKYGVKPCLSGQTLQKTYERLKQLIIQGVCRDCKSNLEVDSSGKEEWVKTNPYCVAYEKWEELAYKVCGDIKLKVSVKDVACDIAFIVTGKEVDCSLQYAIESNKKDCSVAFDVTEKEWNSKVKNTPYSIGKKLSKCGISFDHVVGMEKCGITTSYNESKKCPQITYESKTVVFSDLDIDKDFSAEEACKYLGSIIL